MLTPLVNWVEKGQAPDSVIASARGAGNRGGVNADVPASWSADAHAAAVRVPEGRALQRQRQHRAGVELRLPIGRCGDAPRSRRAAGAGPRGSGRLGGVRRLRAGAAAGPGTWRDARGVRRSRTYAGVPADVVQRQADRPPASSASPASRSVRTASSRGRMNERTSPVDGKRYAIGFEMRLPEAWNGRFFYQANGGVDGSVVTATGGVSGGPGLDNALPQGFAVISSDAGHSGAQNGQLRHRPAGAPRLRLPRRRAAHADGQAALIRAAYGSRPTARTSAAARTAAGTRWSPPRACADEYDGFLVGDPGYRAAARRDRQPRRRQDLRGARQQPGRRLDRLHAGRAPARLGCGARALRRARRRSPTAWCRTRRLPGGVRSRPRRADLQRRARRHLPVGGAEVALATALRRRTDRATASRSMPASRTTPASRRTTGRAGSSARRRPATPAPWPTSGRCRRPIRRPSTAAPSRSPATSTRCSPTCSSPTRPTPSRRSRSCCRRTSPDMSAVRKRGAKIVLFHGTSDPIFSSDHSVAGLRRAGAAASARERGDLRTALPRAGHEPLPRRPRDRSVRPAHAARRLGRARPGTGRVTANARGAGNAAGVNATPPTWSATHATLCPYPAVARTAARRLESARASSAASVPQLARSVMRPASAPHCSAAAARSPPPVARAAERGRATGCPLRRRPRPSGLRRKP